ncbi:serine/threonine protein kinase [Leptothoe spongobia]|uniref:Serine/threonine protein kinase n=1 Tax=Leptothoe spongobia TAU-MAC 1115 TaxID=1967444 RepID=A0A947DF15_9CYAN|nr:serine/threonine-protein kinase [Leptothoe spongobia]MBT9315469.1 serine/threonine protein kinase [Leptothoe spongobia TAU-MAC 1115]
MPDSNLGRRLANRYELMDSIGQGSMGKVYLAKDMLLGGVPVAVKFLAQTLLNEQMNQRFMHEAMTCAQLGNKSIHVIRVTDYGVTDDEVPFYVMEYLKGQNLGQMLQPRPLQVRRFRDFIRQICLGLEAAHKGIILNNQVVPIIHRDIKPSNILVTQSASIGDLVKILDFGIAKLMQANNREETSTFLGTLAYASPEQMEGQELDNRSDLYSLGIMMYQMLTGSLPFRPTSNTFGSWYNIHRYQEPTPLDDLSPYGPLPKSLKDAVMSCLAKEPSQRPSNVSQLLDRLITRQPKPQTKPATSNNPFHKQVWPKDKPIAEIVFQQLISVQNRQIPALWVMMQPQEIKQHISNTGYNNFLFTLSPHPMVLWVTAFYGEAQGPRWLSSYLDLKKSDIQTFIWCLAETGNYPVLFFSKDFPNQCVNSRRLHIASPQQKLLKEWVLIARAFIPIDSPQTSKNILRKELNDNLKPRMLW